MASYIVSVDFLKLTLSLSLPTTSAARGTWLNIVPPSMTLKLYCCGLSMQHCQCHRQSWIPICLSVKLLVSMETDQKFLVLGAGIDAVPRFRADLHLPTIATCDSFDWQGVLVILWTGHLRLLRFVHSESRWTNRMLTMLSFTLILSLTLSLTRLSCHN